MAPTEPTEPQPQKTSSCMGGAKRMPKPKPAMPAMPKPKPAMPKKGGSVLSDMSKLAVPFGLIAAKSSLEAFLKNRKSVKKPAAPVKAPVKAPAKAPAKKPKA